MKTRARQRTILALAFPLALCSLPSFGEVLALMSITAGGISQNYQAATTAPNTLTLPGALASLQFSGNANCVGLACQVDGPALGAYITSNGQTDSADSSIRYNFTVLGAPDLVPILVSGRYQTINPDELPDGAGGTQAASLVSVLDSGRQIFNFQSICYNYSPELNEDPPEINCGSGIYQSQFNAIAGNVLTVGMRALAFRKFFDAAPGAASAFVDPFFQIDPVWAATHPGYSLSFDPGVGNGQAIPANGAPIPEPGALALTMAGLIAFAMRALLGARPPAKTSLRSTARNRVKPESTRLVPGTRGSTA